jgi:hypothetical protein
MKTRVVNKYRESYDIYIGRGSKWGNPFSWKPGTKAKYRVKDREEALKKYREWVLRQPELMDSLHELKVKYLAVFASRGLVMETSSSN